MKNYIFTTALFLTACEIPAIQPASYSQPFLTIGDQPTEVSEEATLEKDVYTPFDDLSQIYNITDFNQRCMVDGAFYYCGVIGIAGHVTAQFKNCDNEKLIVKDFNVLVMHGIPTAEFLQPRKPETKQIITNHKESSGEEILAIASNPECIVAWTNQ